MLKRPIVSLLLLVVSLPPTVTLWRLAGVLMGATLAGRAASAQAQCHGCDCCAEDQDCQSCPGTDDPVCCPIGWRCVKDFFWLNVHCEPPCSVRAECTAPCSDGEGDCFIGCCLGANRICDHQSICTGDPCPEEDRCGRDCCNPGVACVDDQCSDGCASPCGNGETCQNGQCAPGGSSTPTPAVTPTGMLAATVTPTMDPGETPSPPTGRCDAGKLGCVAKRQACLLKVHAIAESKGVAPDADALQTCVDAFSSCVGKLESKQNPAKPKTLCAKTGDLVGLTLAGDAFVTDVVTAIDPSFPTVGAGSVCDGGKKVCVSQRTACLLKLHAAATKKGVPVDSAFAAKCTDKFDGGAKGFAKGCIGKLQAKQNVAKPKTVCAVTSDGTGLATRSDAFVDAMLEAVLDVNLD